MESSRSSIFHSDSPRLAYIAGMRSVVLDWGYGCMREQVSPNLQAPVFKKNGQFLASYDHTRQEMEVLIIVSHMSVM